MKLKDEKFTKAIIKPKKGITVFYKGLRPKGVPEVGQFSIKADPFDELKDAAAKLRAPLIRVVGLNPVSYLTGSEQLVRKMSEKEIKTFEKSATVRQAKQIEITGVTMGYDDDGELVRTKLIATYANEKGEITSICSPLVHLDREDYYGIEEELKRDILALIEKIKEFQNGSYNIFEEPEEEEDGPGEEEEEEELEDVDMSDFGETETTLKVVKKKQTRSKKAA